MESLARLPRLTLLDLTHTNVTGRGLKFLSGHGSLRVLELSITKLDDPGLSALGAVPALTSLDLSNTRIAGGSLARLQNCPRLEILSIAGCAVSRRAVQSLRSAAPALRSLDCSGCASIDDETIEVLRGLAHLQAIECQGTRVFDSWNGRAGPRVEGGSNGVVTALTNAEIDEAAALDLSAGGMLRRLTLSHCRLSSKALEIATSSPALRVLVLDGCTILENNAGQLGSLERLESLTIRDTAVDAADLARVCGGHRLFQLALGGSAVWR